MDIYEIIPNHLYSIKYDEKINTEYYRLFYEEWTDVNYLVNFFQSYPEFTNYDFWGFLGNKPEKAASYVLKDAYQLESYLKELAENSEKGDVPDLDDYFKPLNGRYGYGIEFMPMKGYGVLESTFLRLYAIRFHKNCYLLVYGGIKLNNSIQNSPVLQDNVFQKLDRVRSYLINEGILDVDDI
jgi:hypothetical protein